MKEKPTCGRLKSVVDDFRSRLMKLSEVLHETDPEQIPQKIHSWAVGVSEVTIPNIEEPMRYLEGKMEKYLPPEPDDEEDQDEAT